MRFLKKIKNENSFHDREQANLPINPKQILEEIEKYFSSNSDSNENFKICFQDYLTLSTIFP